MIHTVKSVADLYFIYVYSPLSWLNLHDYMYTTKYSAREPLSRKKAH